MQGAGVIATGTRYRFDSSTVDHQHFTEFGEEQQGAENFQSVLTVRVSRLGQGGSGSNKTDDVYERIHTHGTRER